MIDSCNGSRSLISSITLPIRSSFFASDFASRIAVFGCIICLFIAITAVEENMQHWPCLFSASTTSASKKCVVALRYPYARRAFPDFPISRFPDFDVRTGLRHCLVLATADPALAALRPVHDHARTEHARHARCTRASLASDPHALTLQHALARQKQGWRARVTGHLLTVGRPAACTSDSHTNFKRARHLRCSCGACVAHTLCMPCTTAVATVTCAER